MKDGNGVAHNRNIRLMLVDDNQGLLKSTGILCSRNGIEAVCVDSIETAVSKYREYMENGNMIDLVITDMTIGEYDTGEELLDQLRMINPMYVVSLQAEEIKTLLNRCVLRADLSVYCRNLSVLTS